MSRSEIVSSYIAAVDEAYSAFEKSLKGLKERASVTSNEAIRNELLALAGRCGALCSAASKVAKRTLIFEVLLAHKKQGLDITQTFADQSIKRILGRSVSAESTREAFATPGRTAAQRSTLKAEDLEQIEADIDEQLDSLLATLSEVRSRRSAASQALLNSLKPPKEKRPAQKIKPDDDEPPPDANIIWGRFD
ncbi:hypothetical protein [Stutzerimonas zhaodongensis]|uniref:hypothetical protein n=1 Tax=Stutzerimonas zhaodongensis TaxID=1176257 RepID=UPI002106CAF2|nr:hypothetical protein [Stutzerimonas zhaodongensis]MCQ2032246.1 hypothetical protein [Stutzerimonas zhaodongensis]